MAASAAAIVSCRIVPDQPVAEVEKTLVQVIDDPRIAVIPVGKPVLSPPSPISPEVMQAVEREAAGLLGPMLIRAELEWL